MKLTRGDDEYNGTPEDIATLIKLLDGQSPEVAIDNGADFEPDDFTPVIEESKTVREQIANNPDYNPYPGVVPSKESEQSPVTMPVNNYQADLDTGVTIDG